MIIMGSCIALISVRFDPPGAPDYYPGFSTAAIQRSSISMGTWSRNKFLPGTHLLHLGRPGASQRDGHVYIRQPTMYPLAIKDIIRFLESNMEL